MSVFCLPLSRTLYGVKCTITEDNWLCLLHIASYLQLTGLLDGCERFVVARLSTDIVVHFANAVHDNEFGSTGSAILETSIAFLVRLCAFI